eukprot:m.34492 g.34492  ORF g.34492 m.34492 type:complete len:306 (-) comp16979_c0_seq1:129-1046(-)
MEPRDWSLMSETEKIFHFNEVLNTWREPAIVKIKPNRVIPDTTNRSNTGLSVEHVHFIAKKIHREGFQPRLGSGASSTGHDIPILIRESTYNELGKESLHKWRRQLTEDSGFPRLHLVHPHSLASSPSVSSSSTTITTTSTPISTTLPSSSSTLPPSPDTSRVNSDDHVEFFASLGNGHFFQALNLFGTNHPCIWPDSKGHTWNYTVGDDRALRSAVDEGVGAIILKGSIPRRTRKFLSEVLNSSSGFRWHIDESKGSASLDSDPSIEAAQTSAFEALSKSLDAHELGLLVRQKIGVNIQRIAKL